MRTREGNKERDILQAAVQLFADQGYHKTRISNIADRAGIATGSVYLYFANKEEILNRIFLDLWRQLADGVAASAHRADLAPDQKLDELIDSIFNHFINQPALAIVFVNEQFHLLQDRNRPFIAHYDRFLDLARHLLEEGITRGIFQNSLDIDILRYFVFGGVRNLMHQWAQDPKQMPLQRISQVTKTIVKDGILRHPRRDR
jgi:TetR/AcrR family transcriptional regulator, fatty acid metabolism regulator protein